MSTEVLTQTLTAGQKAVFGAGTMFLVIAAPVGSLNITAFQIGNSNKNRVFTGVPAGFKFTADDPLDGFDKLEVVSASGQTIQLAVGNDDVSYSNSVTVANTVITQDAPAGTLVDQTSPVACPNSAATAVVPANLSRRRVTLTLDPAATAVVYARAHSGTNNLFPLQPGSPAEFKGTYAIDVQNNTGGSVNVYVAEET